MVPFLTLHLILKYTNQTFEAKCNTSSPNMHRTRAQRNQNFDSTCFIE